MNILAMVFALVLMVSLLTIERLEKVKNETMIQNQYRIYLNEEAGAFFNLRQERLYEQYPKTIQLIPIGFILQKDKKNQPVERVKQYKTILVDLINVLYGNADFYKKLESQHQHLAEDLLSEIDKAIEEAPEKTFVRVEDLSQIKLEDKELQEALYHMLKGSINRDRLKTLRIEKDSILDQTDWAKKAYPSLLLFITSNKQTAIPIQRAPRETLKVIFGNDEIVDDVIQRRQELSDQKDDGASDLFKQEFASKIKNGFSEDLFDFKISKGLKRTVYD